ncbi:hypothetical protein ScPMuIL_018143 [Solemya velum]
MNDVYDVAIIGGGVVGCSVLFELTNHGYKCVLLEKSPHLLTGASCGNSGMLHTGFDAEPNSLELRCIQLCQKRIVDVFQKLGLPYNRLGAHMVAWDEKQKALLPRVVERSLHAGISDIEEISISRLYQEEPYLNSGACAALWIPGETILDPWMTPVAFAHHSKLKGAKILTDCRVRSLERLYTNQWEILTDKQTVTSGAVINCAGLYGDVVDRLVNQQSFSIQPRKGQYLVYNRNTQHLLTSSILPVPTERTKGVIVFKTDVDQRDGMRTLIDPAVTRRLISHAHSTIPLLKTHSVVHMYSGIRPATRQKDYQIKAYPERNWITVGGIRSTGVSACLGIAEITRKHLLEGLKQEPSGTPISELEQLQFDYSSPGLMKVSDTDYTITHPITVCGLSRPPASL